MKKAVILLTVSSIFLSSCSIFIKERVDQLTLAIAPSAIPSEILDASISFRDNLKTYLYQEGYDVKNLNIKVYDTHAQTLDAITNNEVDIAYLPVLQYLKVIDQVNYLASIQRPQLALGDEVDVYNTNNEKIIENKSFRNALIYTGPSAYGQSLYQKFKNNELITWIDLNVASWCHVVVTSLDGYIYPSLWLIDQYNRRMGELFDHTLEVRGYEDVVKSLADESCDIAVGPSLLRYDYETSWMSDYARTLSIFDEVKVIGVTDPIYDDVFVYRLLAEEDDPLSAELMTLIQNFLLEEVENDSKLYQVLGFEGIEILSVEEYETMIPALEYIERIMS